ncbi:MAG TPA: 16S rRNA (guanine(527)-N(7))-methyltransferase RsmG [Candidatus Eremiobacteraceae bacterium]|nr:16S rRNA (guanine(527)-N(7))-methyltransferase RsmG [Candidatus Eremiobacteraceae bacterium]
MPTSSPAIPSEATIQRALSEFGVKLDDKQVLSIQQYIRLLLVWNDKVNLTAIHDPLEILYRHFCESMFGAVAVPLLTGRLADVGSGGGFPGLPLRILRPELNVLLVESNIKKSTFLAEVVRELDFRNVTVHVGRYEEMADQLAPLDYICSRAFGEFKDFLAWSSLEKLAVKNVVLWVGARDLDEIRNIPGWEWREPMAVPQSLRRLILVGTAVGAASNVPRGT